MTLDAYLDTQRMSSQYWMTSILIALVLLADRIDVTIICYVDPYLLKDWGVSVGGGIAALVSFTSIAIGLGAPVACWESDRWTASQSS